MVVGDALRDVPDGLRVLLLRPRDLGRPLRRRRGLLAVEPGERVGVRLLRSSEEPGQLDVHVRHRRADQPMLRLPRSERRLDAPHPLRRDRARRDLVLHGREPRLGVRDRAVEALPRRLAPDLQRREVPGLGLDRRALLRPGLPREQFPLRLEAARRALDQPCGRPGGLRHLLVVVEAEESREQLLAALAVQRDEAARPVLRRKGRREQHLPRWEDAGDGYVESRDLAVVEDLARAVREDMLEHGLGDAPHSVDVHPRPVGALPVEREHRLEEGVPVVRVIEQLLAVARGELPVERGDGGFEHRRLAAAVCADNRDESLG